jgi:acetyl-CoA carboxylase, biotin carboxylase subunit
MKKVLIANRGEIAVRIIRACHELGLEAVAVYSTADADAMHVKLADQAICIGGPSSKDSYLNKNNILSAAIATGCDFLHPGYGFLSENAEFASMVEDCAIRFIGPASDSISKMGDKAQARAIAKQNGIPIIEGSEGTIHSLEEAYKWARQIGYPIMLKASAGGGGRGMRVCHSDQDLKQAFEHTQLEASASFGDPSIYMERYIESPRHIEIQILGDTHKNVVSLFERDCSLQRRHQKMVEEGPSNIVSAVLRRKLNQAAIKLAKAINYVGAGTLEFLVDKKGNHFFIEMNTRIQVEHPVTEMITGVDLVKEQIKIAMGDPISFKQLDLKVNGHAIECRILAENPKFDFRPSPGVVKNVSIPGGFGVRVDTHLYAGYVIPPYYDSLIAKLIVWGKTRDEAIIKMQQALREFAIEGIDTNIEYLYVLMHNQDFKQGHYDTSFFNRFRYLLSGETV